MWLSTYVCVRLRQICGAAAGVARLHASDVTVGDGACDTCGNGTRIKSSVLPKVSRSVLSCASSAAASRRGYYLIPSHYRLIVEEDNFVYSLHGMNGQV